MPSVTPQNLSKMDGEKKTGARLQQFLTKLLMVWGLQSAPGKPKGSAAPFLVAKEEKGAWRHRGNVEKGPGGPGVLRNGDKRRNYEGLMKCQAPDPVRACPFDWVGYRNACYYLSEVNEQEGGWDWSHQQCSFLGATLVIIKDEREMELLQRLRGKADYWVGLRREGERLVWVDGSDFNQTIPLQGRDDCYFLSDGHLGTSGCSQLLPYLCSKPQILPAPK